MSAAHTPTPWTHRKMLHHYSIEAANGVRVARVSGFKVITDEYTYSSEEACEIIVRAVNAHEALVAAVNKLAVLGDAYAYSDPLLTLAVKEARAALAKVSA